jgi:hypothetical protein
MISAAIAVMCRFEELLLATTEKLQKAQWAQVIREVLTGIFGHDAFAYSSAVLILLALISDDGKRKLITEAIGTIE